MICPNCFELCPEGQTRCAECGRALPTDSVLVADPPTSKVDGCTCGDSGVCVACYFAELEGDMP